MPAVWGHSVRAGHRQCATWRHNRPNLSLGTHWARSSPPTSSSRCSEPPFARRRGAPRLAAWLPPPLATSVQKGPGAGALDNGETPAHVKKEKITNTESVSLNLSSSPSMARSHELLSRFYKSSLGHRSTGRPGRERSTAKTKHCPRS